MTRALLAEVRVALSDQASLGLEGLATAGPAVAESQSTLGRSTARSPEAASNLPERSETEPARPRLSLAKVRQVLGDCKRCKLHQTRTTLVFGTGSPDAELLFVGEGPGRDEDLEGEPFVGEAGRLLNRMLQAMGTRREEVYIANVIKCRPPNNRFPERDEVATCLPFLQQQIEAVSPKVVVALGRCALESLLGRPAKITKERGAWLSLATTDANIALMPTFHPAYLLRNPGDKKLVWQDLQAVMAKLKLPHPPAKRPG